MFNSGARKILWWLNIEKSSRIRCHPGNIHKLKINDNSYNSDMKSVEVVTYAGSVRTEDYDIHRTCNVFSLTFLAKSRLYVIESFRSKSLDIYVYQ